MKFEEIISNRKEYTIGFLGGSLTEGFGASEPKYRYSSLLVTMLNKRFPGTHFSEVNAAVGGTDSSLGLFKINRELLDKGIDMLFIEYAANDKPLGTGSFKYYESIIRIVKRRDPNMPVFCVFADPYTRENGLPPIVAGQMKIAEYYKLPWSDTGVEVQQKINEYGGDRTFFTIADGHPSDYGYKVYVDCIMRDLLKADFEFIFPETPLSGTEFKNPKLFTAEDIEHNDDWIVSSRTMASSDLHYLCSDKVGASIEFEFTGTMLGLYCRFEKSCGNAYIYLDGKLLHNQNFFDKTCLGYDRNLETVYVDTLPDCKHTVKLVINDKIDERTEGHAVRIGAFLTA